MVTIRENTQHFQVHSKILKIFIKAYLNKRHQSWFKAIAVPQRDRMDV